MKVQNAATNDAVTNGWTLLADLGQTLGLALAAGLGCSLFAGLVVFVVTTVN